MPTEDLPYDHIDAVVVRSAIAELRFPRFCANRHCRRHKRCCDIADRNPRCIASLHPGDVRRLTTLACLAGEIMTGRRPPLPPDDPEMHERIGEALCVLYACFDDLPWFQNRIRDWHRRYEAPPQPEAPATPPAPPAPTIDTGKLLAEMKAEVERYRMIDETRAETEALKRRVRGEL